MEPDERDDADAERCAATASRLMRMALALLDRADLHLAAARLQHAIDEVDPAASGGVGDDTFR